MLLNIFPSIDTGTCATICKIEFNTNQQQTWKIQKYCVFLEIYLLLKQSRFCGAEGIKNVIMLSDFNDGNFGKTYGLEISDSGAFANLHSRAVIVINPEGNIIYTEQVSEIANEPNYDAALAAIK